MLCFTIPSTLNHAKDGRGAGQESQIICPLTSRSNSKITLNKDCSNLQFYPFPWLPGHNSPVRMSFNLDSSSGPSIYIGNSQIKPLTRWSSSNIFHIFLPPESCIISQPLHTVSLHFLSHRMFPPQSLTL